MNTLGDFRPGPVATDWICVSCATSPATGLVSQGFIKVAHPSGPGGIVKLNLISVADALGKLPFPGMVKVVRGDGLIVAADLVPTTDSNASPVRIYTGAGSGIWAWKRIP